MKWMGKAGDGECFCLPRAEADVVWRSMESGGSSERKEASRIGPANEVHTSLDCLPRDVLVLLLKAPEATSLHFEDA
jgi:hypothetical protein